MLTLIIIQSIIKKGKKKKRIWKRAKKVYRHKLKRDKIANKFKIAIDLSANK